MLSAAAALIGEPDNELTFSSVRLWEVAIKAQAATAPIFVLMLVRSRSLFDNEYAELAVTGAHAAALAGLPPIHKDPLDCMLVAQAIVEGLTLLTSDPTGCCYPGTIRLV